LSIRTPKCYFHPKSACTSGKFENENVKQHKYKGEHSSIRYLMDGAVILHKEEEIALIWIFAGFRA